MQCEQWVLITDRRVAPELGDEQLALIRAHAGCEPRVVDCARAAPAEACAIPAFPALCHLPSGACSLGLHDAAEDMEALLGLQQRGRPGEP